MTEYISFSTEETEEIASRLARELKKGDFVAMYGDLGVGKTAFVRGLAGVLAPTASVKSPTYTVVNEYKGKECKIYHFDVYRIEDDDDLYSIGFYDYVKKGISVCEWSENIPYAIPENAIKVTIERVAEDVNRRKITINKDLK
ncbi:MAG: tRNA (adenosine(37)-N6)-threonylcarbamoyltransferase complex ATPase subunit type 1 TsaE [Clostridia bacterium]|nr:tRNA (adenosine(37)-N6)-threonylcarbamoyltransferase complex ATPase subunit type 1 TsaE [Clostridia bacterium]